MVGGLEQVHAHLRFREVIDGQVELLVQKLGVAAVNDCLAREGRTDAARQVLEVDNALTSRNIEVEDTARAMAERARADSERHVASFPSLVDGFKLRGMQLMPSPAATAGPLR